MLILASGDNSAGVFHRVKEPGADVDLGGVLESSLEATVTIQKNKTCVGPDRMVSDWSLTLTCVFLKFAALI